MNALQRLELFLTGKAYVGHRTGPGWNGTLPFYAFRCHKHGMVEDYQRGWDENLDCPKCVSSLLKSVHPDLVEKVVQVVLDG